MRLVFPYMKYLSYGTFAGEGWDLEHLWESWGCPEGLDLTFDSHNAKVLGQPQYQRILRELEVVLRAQVSLLRIYN